MTANLCESAVPLDELVIGYPKLSGRMGSLPETAIFRRFGALNAQDLLYQQAEIIDLEKRLRDLEKSYSTRPGLESKFSLSWFMLSQSAHTGDSAQWQLIQDIRRKLKEYNKSLIHQSLILALSEPDEYDLSYIQRYLATREMGPLALSGRDCSVWGSTKHPNCRCPDLVTLKARRNEDAFSKWVTSKLVVQLMEWGTWVGKQSKLTGLVGVDEDSFLRLTFWVTTVIASLLPVVSISILYYIRSISGRLVAIAAFNLVLSALLLLLTTAKRADVFAAVAAFSAVQAVFVGVGTGCNNTSTTMMP